MATISNTPRPGYVFDVTDNVWYPIGTGSHNHSEIASTIVDAKGDIIAATAADTVSRLAVGANGTVLTAASGQATGLEWATPSSGGMTLLSTTSLTGSSTTISSISQSYKNLIIYGRGIYASAQLELAIRLNGDTGSNYAFQFYGAEGEISYANWSSSNSTGKIAWVDDANEYRKHTNFNMNIARYTESEYRYVALQNYAFKDSQTLCSNGNVMYNSTTAISSITFLLPSGSFSGGTIYIYGVN